MSDPVYKPSRLEKVGCKVILSKGAIENSSGISSIHFPSIFSTKKRYIWVSGLAGAISALICALAALYADQAFIGENAEVTQSKLYYYLFFWGITGIAVLAEILFLYHYALVSTHRIAMHASTELDGGFTGLLGESTRAALELPNLRNHFSGINPTKYANKRKLFFLGLLYKMKVMLTNAAAKLLVSKVIIRGSVRSWIEFVAVPITALWNAWIGYRVMQEVQLRIVGPKVLLTYIPPLLKDRSDHFREIACRAVACSVTASLTLHPNLVFLLELCQSSTTFPDDLDVSEVFIREARSLSSEETKAILQILSIASIVDNRVRNKETELLNQFTKVHTVKKDLNPLQKAFLNGEDLIPHLDKLIT